VLPPIRAAQLDDLLTGDEKQREKGITVMIDKKPVK
jgi:hypothetical protein